MAQSRTSRSRCKTPSRHTAQRLVAEAGLNPAQARVVLDILVDHLQNYTSDVREPGVIIHTAVSASEPGGVQLSRAKMVPVRLDYFLDSDADTQEEKGTVRMRMLRLYRLCREAKEQWGLLSHEDLSHLLCVDLSTVGDLVRRLRDELGLVAPTRGREKDLGPEPSHKKTIARLLAQGLSTSQIRTATGHSEHSIGRYQHDFALVLYLLHHFPEASDNERRALSGLSAKVYYAYKSVHDEVADSEECRPHLERLRRRFELDRSGAQGFLPKGKRRDADPLRRLEQQNLDTVMRQTIQEDLATTRRVAEAVAEDLRKAIDAAYELPDALRPGEVVVFADRHDPALLSGEKTVDRPVISVRVPLYTAEIQEVWRGDEKAGRRRALIACRVADAAREQGAIMSIAGLAELLHVSPGTLAKDLREYAVETETRAATKGLIEDAGPTLTHKDWIIDLDEHGFTGAEISSLTLHAPVSRDRYIETYRRIELLARLEGGLPEPEHVANLLGIRRHVAEQYLEILRRKRGGGN
jgi:hypothetical protein